MFLFYLPFRFLTLVIGLQLKVLYMNFQFYFCKCHKTRRITTVKFCKEKKICLHREKIDDH